MTKEALRFVIGLKNLTDHRKIKSGRWGEEVQASFLQYEVL